MENRNELIIEDEDSLLEIELVRPVFDVPDDFIEISYYQSGEDGWGAGGDEYLLKDDVLRFAEGVRGVVSGKLESFSYSCGGTEKQMPDKDTPTLIVELSRSGEVFRLSVSMLETLERESYINIEKSGLSEAEMREYAEVFYEWEREVRDGEL